MSSAEGGPPLIPAALVLLERAVDHVSRRYPGADVDKLRSAGRDVLVQDPRAHDPAQQKSFGRSAWLRVYNAVRRAAAEARPFSHSGEATIAAAEELHDEALQPSTDSDMDRWLADACEEVAGDYVLCRAASAIQRLGEDGLILAEDHARRGRALQAVMAALSAENRRLVDLRLVQRRPAREVAAILGISKATVDRRCRALRANLRRALAAEEIDAVSSL